MRCIFSLLNKIIIFLSGRIPPFLAEESDVSLTRERQFRDRSDPLEFYNDPELVQSFRFSSTDIIIITEIIVDLNSSDKYHAAHPHVQVCVAIQFFVCYFQIICGSEVHASQSPASRYIRGVALGQQS